MSRMLDQSFAICSSVSKPQYQTILTPSALSFLVFLHRSFNERRLQLLEARRRVQADIDRGVFPTFLKDTAWIRSDEAWRGSDPAPGLIDRRVEITGPVDRKMVINALNAEATQFMADFEDSNAPSWENCMDGQVNLTEAMHRCIELTTPNGKQYRLKEKVATLLVRPRGWHLDEKHALVDGVPISASLFDFGLYFFHNAKQSMRVGQGPYFYLPKMEHHLEAQLWNDVFIASQDYLELPRGTIRATVLIETILAAFQMDEIIYQLREHSAGLNCGRWDYIFSIIKKFRAHRSFLLPDRSLVTMTSSFMHAYVQLLIQTCHRRGVHAMGGMAAQIPIKSDPVANEKALERVRADKLREVLAGHDGTWVAHPELVLVAKEIFDRHMPGPNQLTRRPATAICIRDVDLLCLDLPGAVVTEAGVRANVSVSLVYIEAWLRGLGCVPIDYLMEDAATAEISRTQLWQWLHHGVSVWCTNGTTVQLTKEWIVQLISEELSKLSSVAQGSNKLALSQKRLLDLVFAPECPEFLTTTCYDAIMTPILPSPCPSKL